MTGSPRMIPRGSALKLSLIWWALTQAPLVIRKIDPRKIVIVPSVTTIEGIPSFQTRSPLMLPRVAPSPIAARSTSGSGTPAPFSNAATIPHSARLAATERSMHFVRMTIIWPSASSIRGAVSLNTFARLAGSTKAGNRRVTIPMVRMIASASSASRCIRRIMRPPPVRRRPAQGPRASSAHPSPRPRCAPRASRSRGPTCPGLRVSRC